MATRKIYNSLQILGNGSDDILILKGSDNSTKIKVNDSGSINSADDSSQISLENGPYLLNVPINSIIGITDLPLGATAKTVVISTASTYINHPTAISLDSDIIFIGGTFFPASTINIGTENAAKNINIGSGNDSVEINSVNVKISGSGDSYLLGGNLGIGTSSPTEKLHIVGSIRIVDGNEASGYVLVSDSSGIATWTDPSTIGADIPDITLDYIPKGTGTSIIDGTWHFEGNDLVPNVDGSNIGSNASPQQRIGTIYMASEIDYANDLEFRSGGTEHVRFETDGYFNIGSNARANINGSFSGTLLLSSLSASIRLGLTNEVIGGLRGGSVSGLDIRPYSSGTAGAPLTFTAFDGGGYVEYFKIQNVASGFSDILIGHNGGNIGIGTSSPSAKTHIKGTGTTSATSSLKIEKSDVTQMVNLRDDGRFFIGTTTFDPVYATFADFLTTKLAVQSNTSMFASFTDTVGLGLVVYKSGESGNVTLQAMNTADSKNAQIGFKATNGHMSYGFSSLEHNDNKHNFWLNVNADKFSILNYDTRTAGQGSNIYFHARSENGSNTYPELAIIKGLAFENAGDATNSGYLTFSTANNASPAERMRIDKNGNVGIGTTSIAEDSILELSSTTKAFLPPRVTTAQRDLIGIGSPLTPTEGLVVYNTDNNDIEFYDGSVWKGTSNVGTVSKYSETLTGSPSIPADTPITVTHNLGSTDIIVQLWDLSDGSLITALVDNRTTNSVDVEFQGTAPSGDVRVVIMS